MSTRTLAPALFLLAASVMPASGQAFGPERESLKGLPGFYVLVENLSPDAERDGLTDAAIRTDVEQCLRRADIRVLASSEELFASSPAAPYLYVNVQAERGQMGATSLYVYRIDVQLNQWVHSQVTGNEISGVTWHRGSFGTMKQSNLPSVRQIVTELVNQFISDFRVANSFKSE